VGRAGVLALACALSACAAKPPVILGERMPAGCTAKTRSERCVGWMFDHLLMTMMFKRYEDAALTRYVTSIGVRIAAANHDTHRWTFHILDDTAPQAYAGFNSTIYITRGALAVLRDEAELAAVIAHEMGHTIAGHHREAIEDWMRDVSETELQKWRDLRYARDDEIQADERAVVFLGRTGYDVLAVERAFRAIAGWSDDDSEDASDSTHPVWRERIVRVAALAARWPDGERGTDRYLANVSRLVIGDDPNTVALVDDAVLFAHARIALDLPPGSKSAVFYGMVLVVLPNDIVGTVQLIDRRLATEPTTKQDTSKSFTAYVPAGKLSLAVTVIADDEHRYDHAKEATTLATRTRAPHRDELARLHPMLFDPTRPRPYWAR
jgi:predicted Zn-dependent protease